MTFSTSGSTSGPTSSPTSSSTLGKRILAPVSALALALVLAGCSGDGLRKTFGLEANPPDAFDVGTQAPLSLPPELGQLPAPNPGESPTQQEDAAAAGADTLSPSSALASSAGASSPGGQAFLDQAGPPPPGNIRSTVNQQSLVDSRSPGFVSNLMGAPSNTGPTVDAAGETRRLQENEALGKPVTSGDTPDNSGSSGVLQNFLGSIF